MKVLLTGSTGYVGRRLRDKLLLDDTISLRLFVRNVNKVDFNEKADVEIVEGDTFKKDTLLKALEGVHTAIYLIHSMGPKGRDFTKLDRESAENFREASIAAKVKRIIYLGGLGSKETSSKHLRSRIETGEILSAYPDKIETIWFRAGVIIGSGGASYEIIRNLIEKLPIMIAPKWLKTKTQSISINDVMEYLHKAIYLPPGNNEIVDIGSEELTFKDMLKQGAEVLKLKRIILLLPFFSPRLSSYWLIFITPVPYKIAAALIEGLKSETIVQNDNAEKLFPMVKLISYKEAFKKAVEEAEEKIVSRWCDSSGEAVCDIHDSDSFLDAAYIETRKVDIAGVSVESIFKVIKNVGGKNGWSTYNILWRIRGFLDKLAGGYGLNRGRRSDSDLRIGDSLDFWKVADIRENKRLLLYGQMKLPGKAWLEFVIENKVLIQRAYFIPHGFMGRLYWYGSYPFHLLIFGDFIRNIKKKAILNHNSKS